jgi:hypothetical protein
MKKPSPFFLFDIFGITCLILLGFILLATPFEIPISFIALGFGIFAYIRLILVSLVRVAESSISDAVRLGWVFLILLFPVFGSISCLIVVDRRMY